MSCPLEGAPFKPEVHEGQLELIIWPGKSYYGESTGWGNVLTHESAKLKKKFEENEEKLAQICPRAFCWTCCGNSLDQIQPCDHHGRGPRPCSCDLCIGGKPILDSTGKKTAANYSLDL
jgi:hypothetical protein